MKLYIPSFKFTSIQVNKNFSAGSLHVDNNQGPSIMISVGNFKGGDLYIDGVGERQTRNQFVQFDGNVPTGDECLRSSARLGSGELSGQGTRN